jgi:hypothetical protein
MSFFFDWLKNQVVQNVSIYLYNYETIATIQTINIKEVKPFVFSYLGLHGCRPARKLHAYAKQKVCTRYATRCYREIQYRVLRIAHLVLSGPVPLHCLLSAQSFKHTILVIVYGM